MDLSQFKEEEQQKALLEMQQIEMDMLNEQFKKLTDSCAEKCLDTKFETTKMLRGEMTCLDRCVSKYLEFGQALQKKMTDQLQEDVARHEAVMASINS